jgi:hypothetical protein
MPGFNWFIGLNVKDSVGVQILTNGHAIVSKGIDYVGVPGFK